MPLTDLDNAFPLVPEIDAPATEPPTGELELSIVMPCLNERETVGLCVQKAVAALSAGNIAGEVLVADNGSDDGSQELAAQAGARVIAVPARGYGRALQAGIQAARGRYILMGDADDSYDFGAAPQFLAALRAGHDLVQGCRLPAGGGVIQPGAMPWLHRYVGNPGLTQLARLMFGVPVHDIYCGLRAFRKSSFLELDVRSTGMEFATEMILKAALFGVKFQEIPITLWPDGRKSRRPHLRTFRDGWRTLRLFLVYSPRWLFWYPGLLMMGLGILGYLIALPGLQFGGVTFDAHTLLVASMFLLLGFQSACFAIVTTAYSVSHRYLPQSPPLQRFFQVFTLERGILLGLAAMLGGLTLVAGATIHWASVGFGRLDYAQTMRWVIPGVTALTLGASTIFCTFLCGIVGARD